MAKKRANGEGSIRKRSDGRWEGRYTAGYHPETGKRIIKNVLGKTQAECKAKLSAALESVKGIDVSRADEYTVATWLRSWYDIYAKPNIRVATGGVMYYMPEYAREHGTPGYRPFARSCYGEKLGGVVAVLYDVCFLMTMMCAGGLAFSGEGKLLQGFLGVNYWTTAIVTILVSAALCLYGSKLLAKSSGYMMYAIVGVVLLITVLALTRGDCDVTGAFANSAANAKDSSFLHAILGAMQYGCFQSTIVFNVMSVSDVLKDKKEARKAILSGYVITIVLMVCLIFTLFSYTNVFDVCAEALPVMAVLNRLGMKWLQWLYVILMTLAVLTSAAGLAHAGNVRFDGLFQFIPNKQLRRFVITAILLGIAAVGAALGFQAMLQQGTSIVGWTAIPVIVIPAFTFVAAKVRKGA